jgi:hypothetical protein
MGSEVLATNSCIRRSRIMKLVAEVSSSSRRQEAPVSSASTRAVACDVEPDASSVEKLSVPWPPGR